MMPAPEFSRIFPIAAGASSDGEAFVVEANAEERAALARRFGLLSLEALSATGRIEPLAKGRRARLTATLQADVVQACVITLAPVPAHVEDTFSVEYDRDAPPDVGEVLFDPEGEEPPDPLPEEGVDVGEAVAEHFGLALDPYPRAPGATLGLESGDNGREERDSPFAALRKLRKP